MQKIKYGLFRYETENIGDEVQSLAAKRFLPRIDYYFDRDNLDATKTKPNEIIKIIMNGWFTHKPENWPPKNSSIKPLLVAMHVEQDALDGRVAKAFITKESREFFKKYGPVGARNIPTYEFLKAKGIDSYFSGCVTLTLVPDKRVKRQEFVLAVDVSDKVFEAMKKRTSRQIIRLDTYRSPNFTDDEKFLLAKYWLYLYQSAHSVVTPRLHTMLPCLAFKTPVFAIAGRDPKRYSGLIDLVRHSTEKEFLDSASIFDLDNPGDNPSEYLGIRKSLEKLCADYTGYDSKCSYLGKEGLNSVSDALFAQVICNGVYASLQRDLAWGDLEFSRKVCKAQEKRIADLTAENERLEKLLEKYAHPTIRTAVGVAKRVVFK